MNYQGLANCHRPGLRAGLQQHQPGRRDADLPAGVGRVHAAARHPEALVLQARGGPCGLGRPLDSGGQLRLGPGSAPQPP